MYNNVYNAGFYPQTGMSQGFAVNTVPPSLGHGGHEQHEDQSEKIVTALECLAALGGAAILYKATKGKLHNVNTAAEQSSKASRRAARQAAKQAAEQSAEKGPKRSLGERFSDWIDDDMYRNHPEELAQVRAKRAQERAAKQAAKAAGTNEKGFIRKVVEAPFKLLWAIVTAPVNLLKGKKAAKVESEVLQLGYEPSARREAAKAKLARHADLGNTTDAIIVDAAQEGAEDSTTVALEAWKPDAQ